MPWLVHDGNTALTISTSLAGLILMSLSFSKGKINEMYRLWVKYVV